MHMLPSVSASDPSLSQSGTKLALDPSSAISRGQQVETSSKNSERGTPKIYAAPAVDAQEAQEISREQLEILAAQLDQFVAQLNKGLSFRVDEQSGRHVVTVYEKSSGDVIRQIPAEEMLEITQQVSLNARGLVAEIV